MFLLHFGMHWAQVNGFALRLLFVRCGGERWQKLLPAVVTAKAERRSITLGTWHGRFVHRHTADRVDGHVKKITSQAGRESTIISWAAC